jgi:hypothetical protein
LVFEARDGGGITPGELAILAAVYSVVGNKETPVRITRKVIRRRSMGYKTAAVMTRELPRRGDRAKPLSDWQVRAHIENLSARKFFVRATYGRRFTYYSNRMTESELRDAIVKRLAFRAYHRASQRSADADLTRRVKQARAKAPPGLPTVTPPLGSGA